MEKRRYPGDPSIEDPGDVARKLHTDLELGLSPAEAKKRLASYGQNELRAAPPTPAWRKFLAQFQDPLIYLLLVAVVVSLFAWVMQDGSGLPVDAIVIGAIVFLNAILGLVEQLRAERAVMALQRLTTTTSAVVRDGATLRVPSAELVPGDLLVLHEGDAVGADARLLHAASLLVQEASLTGESEAVRKDETTLPAPLPLGDRLDMVFKGTVVLQGTCQAVITGTGMDTEIGKIAELLESAQEEPTPLQREIRVLGRTLGTAVVIVAAVVVGTIFFLSDIRTPADGITVLLLGVSLAVAAVPEGLPAILSVVLALGVQRMAKHDAIVKKLSSVETLGSASVICSDKTGTLTKSEMTVVRVVTASGSTKIAGVGYAPAGRVEEEGGPPGGPVRAELAMVLRGGSLANDAVLREVHGGWELEGDPTDAAFLVAEVKLGSREERMQRYRRVGEIPFNSARKLMSTIQEDREGGCRRVLFTKGAPDVLLKRCVRIQKGREVVALDDAHRRKMEESIAALAGAALRTLGVAYRDLDEGETQVDESLERDLVFAGVAGMIDPPRAEAAAAVEEAHRAGIRVMMITGDHPRTAERIAADLGIVVPGEKAISGEEIDRLDDRSFAKAVQEISVYARVDPAHKLRIIDSLQADGSVVAMTGDGVNDAPALKSADIGIAMGITGTEVTKEAAKMILADDNFATIVHAVREGRGIFDNIRKFLRYLLSSNMGEVFTVFFGVVLARTLGLGATGETLVLPLLATQILWINLVTDSGPALAMGVDPEIEDVMALPPRPPSQRIIGRRMWVGVICIGALMAAVTLLTIDLYLPGGLIEGDRDLRNARTAGFTVLVLAQLFNCFNSRSETTSAFHHLFLNPWLWGAVTLSFLLQVAVVHLPVLHTAFGTSSMDLGQWLVCISMASAVLWFSEVGKLVQRALSRRTPERAGHASRGPR